MTPSLLLAQITDTHLLPNAADQLRGCNPWQTLTTVLQHVALHQPDGLLLSGDVADQGDPTAYQQIQTALAPLNRPVYWLPGNHDDMDTMRRIFSTPIPKQATTSSIYYPHLQRSDTQNHHRAYGPCPSGIERVDLGSWQLILLSSVFASATYGEGHLSPSVMAELSRILKQHAVQPTAIALHHHPVSTGIDWLDQIQVQNADEFLDQLGWFPQVKLVLFGHIHQDLHQVLSLGIDNHPVAFYGCPSTCLQVMPASPLHRPNHQANRQMQENSDAIAQTATIQTATIQTAATTTQNAIAQELSWPGFRLLLLHPDGTHETEVVRVRV